LIQIRPAQVQLLLVGEVKGGARNVKRELSTTLTVLYCILYVTHNKDCFADCDSGEEIILRAP